MGVSVLVFVGLLMGVVVLGRVMGRMGFVRQETLRGARVMNRHDIR
jgi:hypothetical protein